MTPNCWNKLCVILGPKCSKIPIIELFWNIECISHSPVAHSSISWHVTPSPENPPLHSHENFEGGSVLVHVAFMWQLFNVFDLHSSMLVHPVLRIPETVWNFMNVKGTVISNGECFPQISPKFWDPLYFSEQILRPLISTRADILH